MYQASLPSRSEQEVFDKLVKANRNSKQFLEELFKYEQSMFHPSVIELLQYLHTLKGFKFETIVRFARLAEIGLFQGYINADASDKGLARNTLKTFVEAVAIAYNLGTPSILMNKLVSTFDLEATFPQVAIGSLQIRNVKAYIKFPAQAPQKNISISTDLKNLMESGISQNIDVINESPTSSFTFNPGSERIVFDEALINSIVDNLVSLQIHMNEHAYENRIILKNFIDIDIPSSRPNETNLRCK